MRCVHGGPVHWCVDITLQVYVNGTQAALCKGNKLLYFFSCSLQTHTLEHTFTHATLPLL